MGMALRCFLFSSDEGTSDVIRPVMTSLGFEGESCSQATTAVDKLARDLFQLVVVDWDQQPEAGMLISAARERKAAERPLVIAIVSDDASVPKALQAGANSILRKPLVANQATDTLTTARDLLRSRQESAASAAAAAAGASSTPVTDGSAAQPTLRAGEFLQSTPVAPSSGQIETDTEVAHFPEQSAAEQTNPLKDLEPVAAAVAEQASTPPPQDNEPKGLEWYLKARGVARQHGSVLATAPRPKSETPELLSYQTPSVSSDGHVAPQTESSEARESAANEKREEAQLFSYITGENKNTRQESEPRFKIGKGAIIGALVLAACAIIVAPQAPWHPRLVGVTARGQRALHSWLNPQAVTTVTQAPSTHEDFGRAGDEYKLPVAENIPDATTDPAQISVVPVVDPTVKKPPSDPKPEQPAVTPDASAANPSDGNAPSGVPTGQPTVITPQPSQPVAPATTTAAPADATPHTEIVAVSPAPGASMPPTKPSPVVPRPLAPYNPQPTKVPSSLKSEIAVLVPDASGNKPLEAALPAIEPVDVPELTERGLLVEQPQVAYPSNAAGKQGTVSLQVLIGRDGTVQDAKFLQGSLAFARAAIDGVKQWKFKPYTMNGRPVSVQTMLTLKFAPAQ